MARKAPAARARCRSSRMIPRGCARAGAPGRFVYSPTAWATKDRFEEFVIRVINGKDSVPIRVVTIPPSAPPPPQPAEKVPGFDVKGPFSKMFEYRPQSRSAGS
jgi:hypothetical protein